jgi:hypothetical protein
VTGSACPWPNLISSLAISLQNFPGHSVLAARHEHFSASIESRVWADQANSHKCTTCSCAIRLDTTRSARIKARIVRCLVASERRDVQHKRNGQQLTSQVTHSAATSSISRTSVGIHLLHAVSHETATALSYYMQYLTRLFDHSAATCSISRDSLDAQLLHVISHETAYALRCYIHYLTSPRFESRL